MLNQEHSSRLMAEARQAYQQGNLARAEELCRQILAAQHPHPDALNLLGAIAQQVGRTDVAIACLRQAVQADPSNAHYHNNLGVYCTHAEQLPEAVESYRQAIRLRPDFAEAHNNLTYALYGLGRMEEARASGEQALRLRPSFPEANNHLGLALMELDRAGEAAEQFQKALRLQPRLPAVQRNLANAMRALGRHADAMFHFQQALQLDPNFAEVHCDLGDYLKEQGRFEEAVNHFRQALRIKPDYALVYWNMSEFANQGHCHLTQEELAHIQSILQSDRLPLLSRSVLHMTLGNVFDKQGPWDQAFSHFRQGNALRKQLLDQMGQGFDVAAHRIAIDRTIATFTEEFFRQERPGASDSELPVFVVGMPRSGTSLVEQILASHSQAAGAGELWDLPNLVASLQVRRNRRDEYPASLRSMKAAELGKLAAPYLQRLARTDGKAIRVVDKMPQNFLHLGLIALLFPKARVIHCRRDPLDVCLSCYFQNFHRANFAWSLEDLGQYHAEYERLMAHWQDVLPLRMMEVRYEDLVTRQEELTRELVRFCGLEWEDSCLSFHKNSRRVQTASALQVRRPMYNSSIGRWHKYRTQLEPLRQSLGLGSLNYPSSEEHSKQGSFAGSHNRD